MDKRDLKIQALREALRDRVSELVDKYEDRISDLRIEVTELTNENRELRRYLDEPQSEVAEYSVPQEADAEEDN